ncbi:septal ring lytic transglycosylase RlpA family protein [Nocardiopsis sp. EMB25]|uniref:septal ring lytic transglycosylase RlpA family protein n=1 Tax=Nocardiopsis sp. EMB25 TaxID=2835867 RepID=UPI002284C93C|nr:septal ring lytic transglycosylase RlpA family protein [Nocardiopsis sp. EMB25]MCY9783655.1 septal ring lytic transglycosylase RlpA family protein [Nocardiopsis sp. EMB25]
MGQHQPQNTPDAPQDAPTTVGPRLAAARNRKRRTLLIAGSCVLALAVAGTATAAVVVTGAGDTTVATNAAGIPEADPDPLVAEDTAPSADPSAAQRAEQAASDARQSATATGSDIVEEPQETTAPEDDSSSSGSDSGSDAQPTGQGGSCQASFYGADLAGSDTANGETFDPSAMTAAHLTLPFNTMVRVTNTANGSSVTVRINDRGPFIDGRCLDLSTAAFEQIASTSAGVANVSWEVVA